MPTLGPNNMKFLISDQFATTTSAPDSLSTPMIVSGKDYGAVRDPGRLDDIDAERRGLACCRFDGHRDRLNQATPASISKSMGLTYPKVEWRRVGL
jgi:hypothetical protein